MIENKIEAKEGDNQLKRYYEKVKKSYQDDEHHFIFLDAKGSEPSENEWKRADYQLAKLTRIARFKAKNNLKMADRLVN